ncbi:MAG: DUF1015 domain-containing protein, partial [Candidatus Omnitrophica bacterium]|nr:DUF1015 domain-containing protein [Candidatus Omnitrophota bacterium]
MTKIKPFRAVVYNRDEVKDLSKVTCPPYDVISSLQQDEYRKMDKFNLIHILLSKAAEGEDKYQRAGEIFSDWQKKQILIQEAGPAIYFYEQQYKIRGEKKTRVGFIARLKLEENNSRVFAHENTRSEAKEDRLKLVKAVKANLSPIFAVFQDQKRIIHRVYESVAKKSIPFIDLTDVEGVRHKLWRIDSPETIDQIVCAVGAEDVFIADGHHRYEVGCTYRDLMNQKSAQASGDESFNYVLCYFTNDLASGLTILSIHRLVKLAKFDIKEFKSRSKEFFDLEEVKDKAKFFFLMEKGGRSEHLIGFYKDKKYWLLRLKNIKILDKMIPDKPAVYRSLDVSILNYLILNKILGLGLDNKECVEFVQDPDDLISRVDSGKSNIGFLLNPVRMQQIIEVALTGNRMPPKSTYFYPKVLSGL